MVVSLTPTGFETLVWTRNTSIAMEEAVQEFTWTEGLRSGDSTQFPSPAYALVFDIGRAMVFLGVVAAVLATGRASHPAVSFLRNQRATASKILESQSGKDTPEIARMQRFTFSEADSQTEAEDSSSTRAWERMPFIVEREEFYFLKLPPQSSGDALLDGRFLRPRARRTFEHSVAQRPPYFSPRISESGE